MSTVLKVAEVAAMAGDPARTNILLALVGGLALPAGELAHQARVTPQTASGHLSQMVAAGLLAVARQGRHRYYRLASPRVAAMLEAVMAVAAEGPPRPHAARIDPGLQAGRTCYDHLAGRLGVALTDSLVRAGHIRLQGELGEVTESGRHFFAGFGVALPPTRGRVLCKACIDWSERRPHLSGQVGVGLCRRLFALGWLTRVPGGRAVALTPEGRAGMRAVFDLPPDVIAPAAPSANRSVTGAFPHALSRP